MPLLSWRGEAGHDSRVAIAPEHTTPGSRDRAPSELISTWHGVAESPHDVPDRVTIRRYSSIPAFSHFISLKRAAMSFLDSKERRGKVVVTVE